MIYLDNSATSFPKPQIVIDSMNYAMKNYANYGRSGYDMAVKTTEEIYNCRKKIAKFFNVDKTENVVFTYNCTSALNIAIKGICKKGSHFIISDLEHNAVVRPLETLKKRGLCEYSVAKIERDTNKTLENFSKCIRKNTVAIICTSASNVFGIIPPYKLIGKLAHYNNLVFILDCAQLAGIRNIDMKKDNIDILCCSGHKGLYGAAGVGILIIDSRIESDTLIEGGTGSNSALREQPSIMPDKFESGTPNIAGIISLSSAIDFINRIGVDNIYNHENNLIIKIKNELLYNKNIIVYRGFMNSKNYAPILSFNVKGYHSEEVAGHLAADNICVRAGLHCAPMAHNKFNTSEVGTVRISPSIFTKKSHIDFTINSLFKIAK